MKLTKIFNSLPHNNMPTETVADLGKGPRRPGQ